MLLLCNSHNELNWQVNTSNVFWLMGDCIFSPLTKADGLFASVFRKVCGWDSQKFNMRILYVSQNLGYSLLQQTLWLYSVRNINQNRMMIPWHYLTPVSQKSKAIFAFAVLSGDILEHSQKLQCVMFKNWEKSGQASLCAKSVKRFLSEINCVKENQPKALRYFSEGCSHLHSPATRSKRFQT